MAEPAAEPESEPLAAPADSAAQKGWFGRKMEGRKAKQLAKLEEQRKAADAKQIMEAEEGTMICDYTPTFDGAIAADAGDAMVCSVQLGMSWIATGNM